MFYFLKDLGKIEDLNATYFKNVIGTLNSTILPVVNLLLQNGLNNFDC